MLEVYAVSFRIVRWLPDRYNRLRTDFVRHLMRLHSSSINLHLIERRVLCALCGGVAFTDAGLIRRLESHRWVDAEHRIVFEALTRVLPCDALSVKELVPAQAARLGFPDVDWNLYFVDAESNSGLQPLVEALLKASL
jgi:hypothetical protein